MIPEDHSLSVEKGQVGEKRLRAVTMMAGSEDAIAVARAFLDVRRAVVGAANPFYRLP